MDVGVRVSDGSGVARDDVGDLVGANFLLGHFNELELGFFGLDGGQNEPPSDVVKDSVLLLGLGNADDV